MFNLTPNTQNPELQKRIDEVLLEMKSYDSNTDAYAAMVIQLKELYALRELDKPKSIDPNNLITTAGSLAAVIMILNYEQRNVITSKAMSLVKLGR